MTDPTASCLATVAETGWAADEKEPHPNQHRPGSAFKAQGDNREYNVYIETAAVDDTWSKIPEWPLSSQLAPVELKERPFDE